MFPNYFSSIHKTGEDIFWNLQNLLNWSIWSKDFRLHFLEKNIYPYKHACLKNIKNYSIFIPHCSWSPLKGSEHVLLLSKLKKSRVLSNIYNISEITFKKNMLNKIEKIFPLITLIFRNLIINWAKRMFKELSSNIQKGFREQPVQWITIWIQCFVVRCV